jgi:hypothetical protein
LAALLAGQLALRTARARQRAALRYSDRAQASDALGGTGAGAETGSAELAAEPVKMQPQHADEAGNAPRRSIGRLIMRTLFCDHAVLAATSGSMPDPACRAMQSLLQHVRGPSPEGTRRCTQVDAWVVLERVGGWA